jgi:hypothetical protein
MGATPALYLMALETLFCSIFSLFVMFEKHTSIRLDLLELVNFPCLHILLDSDNSKDINRIIFQQGKYIEICSG